LSGFAEPETPLAKIITLYEPNGFEWTDDFSMRYQRKPEGRIPKFHDSGAV